MCTIHSYSLVLLVMQLTHMMEKLQDLATLTTSYITNRDYVLFIIRAVLNFKITYKFDKLLGAIKVNLS